MTIYAVYSKSEAFPEQLFKTKGEASKFVGNAVGVYEVRVFRHLTTKQVVMLSLPNALDFESRLDYSIRYNNNRRDK